LSLSPGKKPSKKSVDPLSGDKLFMEDMKPKKMSSEMLPNVKEEQFDER